MTSLIADTEPANDAVCRSCGTRFFAMLDRSTMVAIDMRCVGCGAAWFIPRYKESDAPVARSELERCIGEPHGWPSSGECFSRSERSMLIALSKLCGCRRGLTKEADKIVLRCPRCMSTDCRTEPSFLLID